MLKAQDKWYVCVKKRYLRFANQWLICPKDACYCLSAMPMEDGAFDSRDDALKAALAVAASCTHPDDNGIKFNLSLQQVTVSEMEKVPVGKFANDQRVKFTYPDYGKPNGYPDYTTHSGQEVTVVRQLVIASEVDEEIAPMYRIRADDGWEGDVHEDELKKIRGRRLA